MKALEQFEVWLVAGSQELYGTEALRQVEEHAREIAAVARRGGDRFPSASC